MERGQNQSKLLSTWRRIFNLIRGHLAFLSIKKVRLGRPTVHGNNHSNISTIEVEQNGLLSKVETPIDASKSVNGVSSNSQVEVEGRSDYGLENVGPSSIPISNSTDASKENGLVVGRSGAQDPEKSKAQPLPGLNAIIPVEGSPNNLKVDMKDSNKEQTNQEKRKEENIQEKRPPIKQGQLDGRTLSIDRRSKAYIERRKGDLHEPLDKDLHVSNGSDQKLPPPPPPPPSLLRHQ